MERILDLWSGSWKQEGGRKLGLKVGYQKVGKERGKLRGKEAVLESRKWEKENPIVASIAKKTVAEDAKKVCWDPENIKRRGQNTTEGKQYNGNHKSDENVCIRMGYVTENDGNMILILLLGRGITIGWLTFLFCLLVLFFTVIFVNSHIMDQKN